MDSLWSIVLPEEDTNLVTNPSAEDSVSGFGNIGSGTVTRVSTYSRRGAYSIEANTGTGLYDGLYWGSISTTDGRFYMFAVDVNAPYAQPMRICFADTSNNALGTPYTFLGIGDWQRVYVGYTETSTTTRRLVVSKNNEASGIRFQVDGLHCSLQTTGPVHEVTYLDGDQPGCKWDSVPHASISTRAVDTRLGGKIVNFDSLGIIVQAAIGVGMLPAKHFSYDQPQNPGAIFSGRKFLTRPVTFKLIAPGSSLANLRSLRKDLIDAMKPDATVSDEPFLLYYSGANANGKRVKFYVVYDNGLESTGFDGFIEDITLRMVGYDPFVYEDGDFGTELDELLSVADANYIIERQNGIWSNISSAFNGDVYAIKRGKYGEVYIAGGFTNVGDANGDGIVKYDPSTGNITSLGTGVQGTIYALAIGADNMVYVGGTFTTAGGIAAPYIAKWNGATWSTLGSGASTAGYVRALAISPDNLLYAGGEFGTMGGVANTAKIAKWSGSAWSALGTGLSNDCYAIAIKKYNEVFVGGYFGTAGGVSCPYIAKWNGTAFSSLAGGMNNYVHKLLVGLDGNVYAGGNFTQAGGLAANYIAKWNGSAWSALGSGLNGAVWSLADDEDGVLWVGGVFTQAGGLTLADRIALWNGYTWTHTPINLPSTPTVRALLCHNNSRYIGYSTAGTATVPGTKLIQNTGTASAYPKIKIRRDGGTSARVEYIRNETTGATIWLNYSLIDGEEIILDFTPSAKSLISSFWGRSWNGILRNSDIAEFDLVPGNNYISVYVDQAGSPVVLASIWAPVVHWAIDGVAA